ncbi:MAG: adenosylcobinamide-GDP ribazoletransferase, partial [Nitriliruptor sp.]|uniref:adenosylcobinamide-GDP ribazoletransferase n=1 Tax=Nitriliruptor sp. TaxID=2448056 RepID=UPI0034A08C31
MRAAFALLTILPVGAIRTAPGRSVLFAFPLVGLAIGAIWMGVGAGVGLWLGPLVGAAAVLTADAIVTGGLHLDGVADVGDVIGSRRRGAEALAVARDPRVGALGVVALVSVMLVRFSLITVVLTSATGAADPHLAWFLLAVPTVGRMAMVAALAWSPPAEGSSTTPLI